MWVALLMLTEVGLLAARHRVVRIFVPLMAVFSLIVLLILLFRRPRL
jgi:hypothetical protein